MAVVDAGDRFARRELGIGMDQRRAAFRLRQQDRVRLGRHDGVEIGVGEAGGDAVDPHQQARALRLRHRILDERRGAGAGGILAVDRDRILEVDDHGVGAARERLVELGAAVGGNEEQRTHDHQASIVPSVTTTAMPPTLAEASLPPCFVISSSIWLGRFIS